MLELDAVQLENGEWAIVNVGPKPMTEKEAIAVIAAYRALAELGIDAAKADIKKKGRQKGK